MRFVENNRKKNPLSIGPIYIGSTIPQQFA